MDLYNEKFINACKNGKIDEAKELYKLVNIKQHINEAFRYSCSNQHQHVAQWLYKIGYDNIDKKTIYDAFVNSIKKAHLELVKWLYEIGNEIKEIKNYINKKFIIIYIHKNFEIIKWIYNLGLLDSKKAKNWFSCCCEYGDLHIVQWLYNLNIIDIKAIINDVFLICFRYNHFEIAKWLYSLGNVNIHIDNNTAFRWCYLNKSLEMAIWLYSLGGISVDAQIDVFKMSCKYNMLKIAQWVYSLGNIDNNVINEAFVSSIYNSISFETARWLYSIGKINSHSIYKAFKYCFRSDYDIDEVKWLYGIGIDAIDSYIIDKMLNECVYNGYIEKAKWLYTICQINIRENNDYLFIISCKQGHIKVAQWLQSLCDDYELTIRDNRIIYYNIITKKQRIQNAIKNNKLDEHIKELIDTVDICPICLSDDEKYWIQLACKHQICVPCFTETNCCAFGCKFDDNFDLLKVKEQ